MVSPTLFNNKRKSSGDLTIFIMSSIASFDIISVVVPEPMFLRSWNLEPKNFVIISSSVAYVALVNPNGIRILLGTVLVTFFINSNGVFNIFDGNAPDCILLDNWVFDSLLIAEKLFPRALEKFKTYLLVNHNLCRILWLTLELPIIFDDRQFPTSISFLLLALIY